MLGEETLSGLVVVDVLIELLRNPILLSPRAACNKININKSVLMIAMNRKERETTWDT